MKDLIDKLGAPEGETKYNKYRRELNDKRFGYMAGEMSEIKEDVEGLKVLMDTVIEKLGKLETNHLAHIIEDLKKLESILLENGIVSGGNRE